MRRHLNTWFLASICLGLIVPKAVQAHAPSEYLPMFEGAKWVLRNSRQASAVVFEIPRRDGDGYRFVSRNPWGQSEWTLVDQDGAFAMTQYAANGKTMPLADRPVWVDFNKRARDRWTNMLGTLEISSRSITVYSVCGRPTEAPRLVSEETNPASSSRRRCGRSVFGCSDSRSAISRTLTGRPVRRRYR